MSEILEPFREAATKSGRDLGGIADKALSPLNIIGHTINDPHPLKRVGTDVANAFYESFLFPFKLLRNVGIATVKSATRATIAALLALPVLPIPGRGK